MSERAPGVATERRRRNPLLALTRARILEFVREPEALFWVFAFPIIMAVVLGFAFRDRPADQVAVGIAGPAELRVLGGKPLASPALTVRVFATVHDGLEALRTGKIALLVENASGDAPLVYHFDPTRPDARIARLEVDDAIQRAAGRKDPVAFREAEVHEKGSRYIDFLLPGILGLNLMGTGIWGIGFSIVNARLKKTLKVMVATPMRKSDFLLAQIGSRFVFLILELVLILAFGVRRIPGPDPRLARAARPDRRAGGAGVRRNGTPRGLARAHSGGRERPHESRHGADVAALGRLLLLGAVPEGRPAVHQGAPADGPERRAPRRDAGGQGASRDRLRSSPCSSRGPS